MAEYLNATKLTLDDGTEIELGENHRVVVVDTTNIIDPHYDPVRDPSRPIAGCNFDKELWMWVFPHGGTSLPQ